MFHIDWLSVLEHYQHYLFAELAWSAFGHYCQNRQDERAAGPMNGICYPREV